MCICTKCIHTTQMHIYTPPHKPTHTHIHHMFHTYHVFHTYHIYTHTHQVRCSWAVVRPLVWSALPFKLINDAAQFAGPYFLQRLLESVRLGHPAREGYMLASAMFVGLVAGTVADAQHFQRMMRAGRDNGGGGGVCVCMMCWCVGVLV